VLKSAAGGLGLPAESLVLPHWLALSFSAFIFVGLAWAYRSHGVKGVAAISLQVLAIVFVQLSTKLVMQHGFAYPTCVALVHFLFVWLVSSFLEPSVLEWKRYFAHKESFRTDVMWYTYRILPIAVLQTANVVMNTTSLKYIGAGFNSIIGILAPVLTALISAVFGARFASMAWLGIVIAIAGDAVISCEGIKDLMLEGQTPQLAFLGMSLGVGALFARSIRSVLMDCQMNQYRNDEACPQLSPTKLVALTSPAVFLFGLILTLVMEGLEPFYQMPFMSFEAAAMLAISAVCAVFLSIMGMYLIKMLGAAAAQIAGKVNILMTMAVSSSFMGERLTLPFVLGAAMVLLGASVFEGAKAELSNASIVAKHKAGKATTYSTV